MIAEAFLLLVVVFRLDAAAQYTHYSPDGDQIPGPECLNSVRPSLGPSKGCSSDDYKFWLDDVTRWRRETRLRAGYSGQEYERQELQWTQSSFIQPQMMVEDRYFYDPVAGKYTVDKYLDDLKKRYGGIDSVLIWPVYPNIGIDNRNQYDMLRAMPGGIAGVRQMVADFHRLGVKVLFPVMLWDQGTRDPGLADWDATAKLLAEVGADGVNGDTLRGIPERFAPRRTRRTPAGTRTRACLAAPFEAWRGTQRPGDIGNIPTAPMVSALSGLNLVTWCMFATVGITPRWTICNSLFSMAWDTRAGRTSGASGTRLHRAMRRRFAAWQKSNGDGEILVSPEWQPYAQTEQNGIYASRWPLANRPSGRW